MKTIRTLVPVAVMVVLGAIGFSCGSFSSGDTGSDAGNPAGDGSGATAGSAGDSSAGTGGVAGSGVAGSGVAGSGGAAGGAAGSSGCAVGSLSCNSVCVNPSNDNSNCGACGTVCPGGSSCTAGACTCAVSTQSLCGSACVDKQTDSANCGACGTACGAGKVCQAGACTCATGSMLCGTVCAVTSSDPANCGGCGMACTTGQVCSAGVCSTTCGGGQTACSGACVNLTNDINHCGMCTTVCASGLSCSASACSCATGQTNCTGTCKDLMTDGANCGTCGKACGAGQTCSAGVCACSGGQTNCTGTCRDLTTDAANCGACGTACGTGQTCASSACACASGQTLCSGTCKSLQTDAANCGTCGKVCATGQTCSAGTCMGGTAQTVCDILGAAGNGCEAAHSTTRLLVSNYTGPLYQVCKGTANAGPSSCKGTAQDIGSVGGYADAAAQDTFCNGASCTITKIYDQTANNNDLEPAPRGGAKGTPDNPAVATDLKTTLNGHSVYGILIKVGIGYRTGCSGCNIKTGAATATGDKAETTYIVTSQQQLIDGCCFDYGNAETTSNDDGNGTMDAVYFGGGVVWGTGNPGGHNNGPWVMGDLENGLYAGWENNQDQNISTNTPLKFDFVTAALVADSCTGHTGCGGGTTSGARNNGRFALYGGDATNGALKTEYDNTRPTKGGYIPMKKQGSIILGIGGDDSNSAGGRWYEGVMANGAATVATLNAIQANIVAAKYGK